MQKIIQYLVLLSCIAVSTSLVATADTKSNAQANASIYGELMDDALSEANIVGFRTDVTANHFFSEKISAHLGFGFKLETGSTQNLFTEEFKPRQQFTLQEAKLMWRVLPFIQIDAGALDQAHFASPIFLDNNSFPALHEQIFWAQDNWWLGVKLQQAIPTAYSYSTRAVGKEVTPSLFNYQAKLNYEEKNIFSIGTNFTLFDFKNLTRGVAQDSRFYGNTVVGLGPEGAQFVHKYSGWSAAASFDYQFNKTIAIQLYGNLIQNNQATDGINKGQYGSIAIPLSFETFKLKPSMSLFRVESDAAPAFYTSKELGHNNRKGFSAALEIELKQEGLFLIGQYVDSKNIKVSPVQADRQFISAVVKTNFYTLYNK